MDNKPKNKFTKYKEKIGLYDLPELEAKKKISAKKELSEITKQMKTNGNVIKGFILSPLFSYFFHIFVLLCDAIPFLDLNIENKTILNNIHFFKIIFSVIFLIISVYSIKKDVKYQPIRLMFLIIIMIINILTLTGLLTNKILLIKEKKKIKTLDYVDIGSTILSEIISIGSLGYALYQYLGLGLRFVSYNMVIITLKMILSIILSWTTIYSNLNNNKIKKF